jgi:hypothetical protein
MKKNKIIFWVATTLIFVFEGVLTALFSQKPESKLMMNHLGYPAYFGIALDVFKVLGAIILMIPVLPKRLIGLAYAGFVFDFIFAGISNTAVDGFGGGTIFPLVTMAVLAVSYIYYNKTYGAAVAA